MKLFLNNFKNFNSFFLGFSFFVFVTFIIINIYVDGNSLNTDRWSALEVSVKSILNLEYPYNKLDHLGKTTSNLPALFYIGLPFYLFGNIGFLQPIVFLGLIFVLYKLKFTNFKKVLVVFLFLFSPSYLWEIYAKSDLMSNLLLLLFFILIWNASFSKNYYQKPFLVAFLIAFFILTRAIVIIPILLFLGKGFFKNSYKEKFKLILSFIFFLFLISTPVLLTLPDFEIIKEHNPFIHQTRVGPKWLQLFFVFGTFITSFFVSSIKEVLYFSFVILSTLLIIILLVFINDYGFNNSVINSYFDISYLGMILPFAIFSFVENLESKLNL